MQMSLVKHPDLPDVPLLIDLAPDEDSRRVFELLSITGELGRPLLTAPGVPPERVAALRKAFDETVVDPEFLADATKMEREIDPIKRVGDGHPGAACAGLPQKRDRVAQGSVGGRSQTAIAL